MTDTEVYRCLGAPMVVAALFVANTETSTTRQVTILHVPADETPDDVFSISHNVNVNAKGSLQIDQPIIIHTGEAIYARGSVANKLVVTLYLVPYSEFFNGRL